MLVSPRRRLLAAAVAAALLVAGAALLGLRPWARERDAFTQSSFDASVWRRTVSAPAEQHPRGQMFESLIERLAPQRFPSRGALAQLLGRPELRRGRADFWFVGRWQDVSSACAQAVFDAEGELRRLGLVRGTTRTGGHGHLSVRCSGPELANAPALITISIG